MTHHEIASRHLEAVVSEMGPGTQAILVYGAPESPESKDLCFAAITKTIDHRLSVLMLQYATQAAAQTLAESN